jgi:gamma-glutamylcyclotransferase (GGCT)/AIG2-like uncharacterized protein YtfP
MDMGEGRVFVYGSLLFSEVWQSLIGRVPSMQKVVLRDYRRYGVCGAYYPGLWYENGATIEGLQIDGLSEEERRIIDVYEGSEYRKSLVLVELDDGVECVLMAYFRAPESLLEWNKEWSAALFERTGLLAFLH